MMHGNTINILVIDEDDTQVKLFEQWLLASHTFHYRLSNLTNYQVALAEILSEAYDVCLINYEVANKKGIALLCEANTQHCDTPLIILTEQDDLEIDLLAMLSGAADYLVKSKLNAQLLERSVRYAIERKQTERNLILIKEKNRRLIEYDLLTGLANRNSFNKTLVDVLDRVSRNTSQVALLFFDLDNFKVVNDSLGHDVGDILLQDVAQRLQQGLRKTDQAFRLGGDEFIIILEGDYDASKIAKVAEKILELLKPPFQLRGNQVFVTASIGIATSFRCGLDADILFKSADTAMYSAKDKGGNNYQFFTLELNEQVIRRAALENNLRYALERKEFYLHYQPRVDLTTGEIIGAEALMRWNNSELQEVPPLEFIPVAEEIGMIYAMGEWVLQTVCEQLVAWQQEQVTVIPRISVNLSMRQLTHERLVDFIVNILQQTGLEASLLELEVTESTVMQQPKTIIAILNQLHDLGIKLSIDDFGTGYSSLAYLKLLPLDALKIDKVFVQDVTSDSNSAVLVKAIVTLAKNLGLSVVAEGVETHDQLVFLRSIACEEMQGYYFSKPVSEKKLQLMLQHNKRLTT